MHTGAILTKTKHITSAFGSCLSCSFPSKTGETNTSDAYSTRVSQCEWALSLTIRKITIRKMNSIRFHSMQWVFSPVETSFSSVFSMDECKSGVVDGTNVRFHALEEMWFIWDYNAPSMEININGGCGNWYNNAAFGATWRRRFSSPFTKNPKKTCKTA